MSESVEIPVPEKALQVMDLRKLARWH